MSQDAYETLNALTTEGILASLDARVNAKTGGIYHSLIVHFDGISLERLRRVVEIAEGGGYGVLSATGSLELFLPSS